MGLSQATLRDLYLKQNPINDFKIGDYVQYVPENIAIKRGFVIKAYMNFVRNRLNDKILVRSINYDSFGEYGEKRFEVMQHINKSDNDVKITASCFFMYDRKTKIKNFLKEL